MGSMAKHRHTAAHAGTVKWGSFAWRPALCVLLAVLLTIAPLSFAYGGEEVPPAPIATADESAQPAESAPDALEVAADAATLAASESDAATDIALDEGAEANPEDMGEPGDEALDESATDGLSGNAPDAMEAGSSAPDALEPNEAELAAEDAPDALDASAAEADEAAAQDPEAEEASEAEALLAFLASRASSADGDGSASSAASAAGYEPTLAPVSGAISLLLIVAGFLGENGTGAVPYQNSYDWNKVAFTSSDGIAAYYSAMSNGAFTFAPASETSAYGVDGNTNKADKSNDGVVHVLLPEAHQNWAGFETAAADASMLAMLDRAFEASSAYVNYANYDLDGDGTLEANELAIAFVIAGYEASDGTEPTAYALWAHHRDLPTEGDARFVADGVTLKSYVAVGEQRAGYARSSSDAALAAKLEHELGHQLGLPDLYDTTYSKYGDEWVGYEPGELSLMSGGESATIEDARGNERYASTALDAWSRYALGWTTPTVVTKGGVYTVTAQDSKSGYTTLLIPTSRTGEYYLIENRTFTGRDAALKTTFGDDYSNGGIVICHIDNGIVTQYAASHKVNMSSHHPGVSPLYYCEGLDGSLAELRDSAPLEYAPFWSKSAWRKFYPNAPVLHLPLYGAGSGANKVSSLQFSGICIEFLTNAGSEMKIRIYMPGDTLPTMPERPSKPAESEFEKAHKAQKPSKAPKPQTHQEVQKASYAPAEEPAYAQSIPATGDEVPTAAVLALVASAALALYARNRRDALQPHPRHVR